MGKLHPLIDLDWRCVIDCSNGLTTIALTRHNRLDSMFWLE
ncbi:MAG: hypothetical protein BMS9Abin15_0058 [Gammaproteobacteria bacterium]|nr:MAG: hypothetical protein BMS9Abin15_0058 [Gammaproteobacteria bacterium]